MRTDRVGLAAPALFCALTLAAAALPAHAAPALEHVRVASMPFLSFAAFTLAQKEGYFAEQGLEVEFVALDRTYKGIPALAAGELDVHSGTPNAAIFNAIAKGADIRFVAGKDFVPRGDCAVDALVVRPDLAPAPGASFDVARLRGKRIAVYSASFDEYLLERILARNGLGLKDVERQTIPFPAYAEAFRNGSVDAAIAAEPWVTRLAQDKVAVKAIGAEEVTPGFARAAIFFGPSLLRERPAVGERFVIAYLKALRRLAEGKTERNVRIVAEHSGMTEDFVRSICWPTLRVDGGVDLEELMDFQAWAIRAGYLDSAVGPERFWEPRFTQRANAALGPAR
ncbi:MAG: ABC transporter substrate-binding protein [Candidatus Methylomirabilia bacterium]